MAWWERAKVGDKVVCINPVFWADDLFPVKVLSDGGVYEITQINLFQETPDCPVRFSLAGFPLGWRFIALHFRPVKSTETGMEVLRGLLQPKTQKIKESA